MKGIQYKSKILEDDAFVCLHRVNILKIFHDVIWVICGLLWEDKNDVIFLYAFIWWNKILLPFKKGNIWRNILAILRILRMYWHRQYWYRYHKILYCIRYLKIWCNVCNMHGFQPILKNSIPKVMVFKNLPNNSVNDNQRWWNKKPTTVQVHREAQLKKH